MLLTLIKKQKTRFGWRAELIETNHLTGNRHLADVHICFEDWPLELIFLVTVPRSGIWIQGRPTDWHWSNAHERQAVEEYLWYVQSIREEIRLEVTHTRPHFDE